MGGGAMTPHAVRHSSAQSLVERVLIGGPRLRCWRSCVSTAWSAKTMPCSAKETPLACSCSSSSRWNGACTQERDNTHTLMHTCCASAQHTPRQSARSHMAPPLQALCSQVRRLPSGDDLQDRFVQQCAASRVADAAVRKHITRWFAGYVLWIPQMRFSTFSPRLSEIRCCFVRLPLLLEASPVAHCRGKGDSWGESSGETGSSHRARSLACLCGA